MARQIHEVMTKRVHTVQSDTPLIGVAHIMRDEGIGDVLVTNRDGTLLGIVTDRDIVVRAVAEGKPVDTATVGDICTDELVTVPPAATVEEAVRLMREHGVRRIPVVRDQRPVGIVSIGDLARHQDPNSALAEISAAAPNN